MGINECTSILKRMHEKCKPDVFYNILRPYLNGSTNNGFFPNGVLYQGTNNDLPVRLAGGSAGQSSLMPCWDVFLGINLTKKDSSEFRQEMKDYMPRSHREFLTYLKNCNFPLRQKVIEFGSETIGAYNDCIKSFSNFRSEHMLLVTKYIVRQQEKETKHKANFGEGSGGTPLATFLKEFLISTESTKIDTTNVST